jgi:hypothetical protein
LTFRSLKPSFAANFKFCTSIKSPVNYYRPVMQNRSMYPTVDLAFCQSISVGIHLPIILAIIKEFWNKLTNVMTLSQW